MKILLDTCVWGRARDDLAREGYDVTWAGDWGEDPGDEEILQIAFREKRVLVTLDKDFGELAIVHSIKHAGIIRLVGFSARKQGNTCRQIIEKYRTELEKGAILTVNVNRVRIRL